LLLVSAACVFAAQPRFPLDWSAIESSTVLIHQGRYIVEGDSVCCKKTDTCNVQTQFGRGMHYYSASTNKTRFDDQISGQVVVNDYVIRREMLIDPNTMQCKEYCPIDHSLHPGFLDKNATDKGQTTFKGKVAQKWQWEDRALVIFVMETTTVLVDQSTDPATPLQEHDDLTPFNQAIGFFENEWENFKGGAQPQELFAVQGVQQCKQSPNCGQYGGIRMSNRMLNKAYNLAKEQAAKTTSA